MPDIMEAQFVRICSLPTMATKVTNKLLIAIFTICRMLPVGHLCLFVKDAVIVLIGAFPMNDFRVPI
jgi:hypothetical protein